jgi:hypothetical protein
MKKGRFFNEFEEPPDYSALSSATENTHYAELGIMAIFDDSPKRFDWSALTNYSSRVEFW